jgi:hypothetical protein
MSLTTCSPRRLRDMSAIRLALAIAAGALTLAVAPMLASPASALAAPNVVGAFANVQGSEPLNQTVSMPLSTSFSSATGSGERGTIRHAGTGIYHVTFDGLVPKDPNGGFLDPGGVVHVRTRTGKVCHAPQGQAGIVGTKSDGKLSLLVECWDGAGRFADSKFTINYTRGGAQQGSLITARMPRGDSLPLNQKVGVPGETSVNASTPSSSSGVTVTRTGVGAYTFTMFAGTGHSTIQVTPTLSGFKPGAVCGVVGTSVLNGIKSVKVQCRGPLTTGPVDVGVNLSYARGINLLGLKTLSSAYLSMPKTSKASTTIQPDGMFNSIFGLSAGATVLRSSPGRYEVRLPNQELHIGAGADTFGVTAEGSTADCQISSSTPQLGFQRLGVVCLNSSGLAIDTAFQLHYAGSLDLSTGVGRLRLSPAAVKAQAGKVAHLRMRWTHPTAWRQLRSVEVRLYRGIDRSATIAISPRSERIRSQGSVRLIRGASLITHRGKAVIARLAVRLPKAMAGEQLRVDVEATDRDGHRQLERSAGLITIAR